VAHASPAVGLEWGSSFSKYALKHAFKIEALEDWKWSNFLHNATGHEGYVEIESEWTANKRERAAGHN
jgi:hypothetical protein